MSRLSSDDWLALVEIARRAISSAILENCIPDLPPYPAALSEPRGAFVSLYCGGILRGCVGQVENPGPLADVVARSAINAAQYDSRFPPISAKEVPTLEIEISVLSAPERILPEAIVAGRHGLMVVRGSSKGLLAAASGHGAQMVRAAIGGGNLRQGRLGARCLARSRDSGARFYGRSFFGEGTVRAISDREIAAGGFVAQASALIFPPENETPRLIRRANQSPFFSKM